MADTGAYQAHHNGPLKQEAVDFLHKIRVDYNWTYSMIGERLGISGGFAHRIMNKQGNITTSKPMPSIAGGIARLEAGLVDIPGREAGSAGNDMLDHNFHLREGMQVTLALPVDLTEREAERLALFVRSLAQ